MPYLKRTSKDRLSAWRLAGDAARTPGELNFLITTEVQRFLGTCPNYEMFNAVIGALECAKLELYRRMVAPYEDLKKNLNGDVY